MREEEPLTAVRVHRQEPPVFSAPFFFVPPARASIQALAGTNRGIAALIDERLRDLDNFGNPGARGDTLYLLGVERQRTGDFGPAADYFEAFALMPGEGVAAPEAAASMENAIVYRRALGQNERALAAVERFVELFGASHPRATT
ncbi:MAG: outer membrane protein assembly factor BamD (BamD/ComL family), partial [Polyangiales bacterium]